MNRPPRVVFDAMIYLQALISPGGPSAKCLMLAERSAAELWTSRAAMLELGDVLGRPEFRSRFPSLTDDLAYEYLKRVTAVARRVDDPPHAFTLPRDPDDEPYTDLAVDVGAEFLVTRNDRHLTYLMRRDTPEGIEFCARFPSLTIVDPVAFLREVEVRFSSPPPPPDAGSENAPG